MRKSDACLRRQTRAPCVFRFLHSDPRRQRQGLKMARSPLMRALQRLAREHAEASRRGVEAAKVREEWAAASLERRRFLQGVGAAGGAVLISRTRTAKAAN